MLLVLMARLLTLYYKLYQLYTVPIRSRPRAD